MTSCFLLTVSYRTYCVYNHLSDLLTWMELTSAGLMGASCHRTSTESGRLARTGVSNSSFLSRKIALGSQYLHTKIPSSLPRSKLGFEIETGPSQTIKEDWEPCEKIEYTSIWSMFPTLLIETRIRRTTMEIVIKSCFAAGKSDLRRRSP